VEVEQRSPRGHEQPQLLRRLAMASASVHAAHPPVDRVQVPADVLGEDAEQDFVHI
jgi:hypothetical protein